MKFIGKVVVIRKFQSIYSIENHPRGWGVMLNVSGDLLLLSVAVQIHVDSSFISIKLIDYFCKSDC